AMAARAPMRPSMSAGVDRGRAPARTLYAGQRMTTIPERLVLVCDDEPQILRALRVVLREASFRVLPAATAAEALDLGALHALDAAIIDLVLPDGDGVEVTRTLRSWSQMPIIVLSAVDDEDEKVRALEAGADDYVTKPFGARELVARLQATLRRARPGEHEPVLRAEGLELDIAAHVVRVDGAEVHLTPKEFALLLTLMRNRGRVMTHRSLLVEVWGSAYGEDTATLRTHLANLRRKVERAGGPRHIRTEPGIGYRFAA
ncbi:MAG: two-component system, OmpR family, operon response regulator KdpE, partial [Thermoleophilaceae bacterium]|nr:two-component system, OmpR family, operon response regulator KdpE [Thermoleophilaceae bacterium]